MYSIPPVRLKERKWWGLFADAGAAHVYPAVFSILMANSGALPTNNMAFVAIVAVWSFLTGFRNIILHQLLTEGRDRESGLNTIVHDLGIERVARLTVTVLALELVSLTVMIAQAEANVVFFLVTAFYVLKEAAQYALGARRISFNPAELYCPFIDNAYYLVWGPLAALASLAAHDPSYNVLMLGFVVLFRQNVVSEWIALKQTGRVFGVAPGSERDLRHLMTAVEERDRRLIEADRDLHRLMAEIEERDRRLVEADQGLRRLMMEVQDRDRQLVEADKGLRRLTTEIEERDRRLLAVSSEAR